MSKKVVVLVHMVLDMTEDSLDSALEALRGDISDKFTEDGPTCGYSVAAEIRVVEDDLQFCADYPDDEWLEMNKSLLREE